MDSGAVLSLAARINCILGRTGECRSVSVDGSFKEVHSLQLQTPYRANSDLKKEVQGITGVDPAHACVSVVGIHGRLLAQNLAAPEGSDSIVAAVCEAVPVGSRLDTFHVATDNQSRKLAIALRIVFPNLKYLSIEVKHIFRSEQSVHVAKERICATTLCIPS